MPSEIFARDDETIMRLLQEWPDLLEIMDVTQSRPGRALAADRANRITHEESRAPGSTTDRKR